MANVAPHVRINARVYQRKEGKVKKSGGEWMCRYH